MFSNNIKEIREMKGFGVNELSRMSGVNASYISALERGEKQNPTITTLKKIADALEVTVDELLSKPATEEKIKEWDKKYNKLKESKAPYISGSSLRGMFKAKLVEEEQFKTAEAAMQFILKQPAIMGYGGFDTNKMSDEDIIAFANELLQMIKMLSPKYK